MSRTLIYLDGHGAIIDSNDRRSRDYDYNYARFATMLGRAPDAGVHAVSLYPDQKLAGRYYTWELAGPGGASFQVIQLPDTTSLAVEATKRLLIAERDVVRMSVLRIRKLHDFRWEVAPTPEPPPVKTWSDIPRPR